MEFPSLRCVASHTGIHEKGKTTTRLKQMNMEGSSVFRNGHSLNIIITRSRFLPCKAVKSFQPVLEKACSSYNKANASTAVKTGAPLARQRWQSLSSV